MAQTLLRRPPRNPWPLRLAVGLSLLLFVASLAWGLKSLLSGGKPGPARQVAKISLLPDTPPPPPPPPKLEKPPEPKDPPKASVQPQAPPAPLPQPANEPIKMEGTAGDGPSAFAAGTVNNDYRGGAPQTGPAQAATAAIDRAQERLYTGGVRQQLRDAMEKNLKSDAVEATAVFSVWLARDGSIQRFELVPSGNAQLDRELGQALDDTARALRLPPPPAHIAASTALRFKLTLRPLG